MTSRWARSVAALLRMLRALLLPVPWLLLALAGVDGNPLLVAILAGAAILGAAFLLSWAAELIQMDVSQALALALLALIAVLPEYAVDAVFANRPGAIRSWRSRAMPSPT
jgi:cation:H+ antiporter